MLISQNIFNSNTLVEPDIRKAYGHAIYLLCFSYVMFTTAYVINYVTYNIAKSQVWKIYVEFMLRLFEKYVAVQVLFKIFS